MTYNLIVVRPFGQYERGARITSEADVMSVLESEHRHHVVQVPAASLTISPAVTTSSPAANPVRH